MSDSLFRRLPAALLDRLLSAVYVIVGFVGLFMAGQRMKQQARQAGT